jgi:hypothetical protein
VTEEIQADWHRLAASCDKKTFRKKFISSDLVDAVWLMWF